MSEAILEPEAVEQTPAAPDVPTQAVKNFDGINIGGNTVVQSTAHLPPDQMALVRWVYDYAKLQDWNWRELQEQTGISTLYRVWTDKYRYPKDHDRRGERIPLDGVCERIAQFKRVVELRSSNVETGFIQTSVWERVDWLCAKVFKRQRIGFLYGESQIGKTTCLLEHQRRNNHGQTVYVEMPPSSGVQLMTKCIARSLHVATKTCFERLLDDILDALDSRKLLLIDEIHRVFTTYQKGSVMRCLDTLRYIHDQTKCGMVLCGTNVFRDQLRQTEFFQYLKQLDRRGGLLKVQLPDEPPRGDLDLVAKRFGLPPATGKAEEVMLGLASADGFGPYILVLTEAVELAQKRKQQLTWDHFVKAHDVMRRMAMGPRS